MYAPKLIALQRKYKACLETLQYAAIEILRRLTREHESRPNVSAHPSQFSMDLGADRTLVVGYHGVSLIDKIKRQPPRSVAIACFCLLGHFATNSLQFAGTG